MPRNLRHNDDLDPRKQAKQARSHSTVQTILEGAAQVFEALGYEQTTTDKIAERAGVSVGSVYEYYPNKDSLLVALSYCHLAETSKQQGLSSKGFFPPSRHRYRQRSTTWWS